MARVQTTWWVARERRSCAGVPKHENHERRTPKKRGTSTRYFADCCALVCSAPRNWQGRSASFLLSRVRKLLTAACRPLLNQYDILVMCSIILHLYSLILRDSYIIIIRWCWVSREAPGCQEKCLEGALKLQTGRHKVGKPRKCRAPGMQDSSTCSIFLNSAFVCLCNIYICIYVYIYMIVVLL